MDTKKDEQNQIKSINVIELELTLKHLYPPYRYTRFYRKSNIKHESVFSLQFNIYKLVINVQKLYN